MTQPRFAKTRLELLLAASLQLACARVHAGGAGPAFQDENRLPRSAAADHVDSCNHLAKGAVGEHAYQWRGDRCEGVLDSPHSVNVGIVLRSFARLRPLTASPGGPAGDFRRLTWPAGGATTELTVETIGGPKRYGMRVTLHGRSSYDWPQAGLREAFGDSPPQLGYRALAGEVVYPVSLADGGASVGHYQVELYFADPFVDVSASLRPAQASATPCEVCRIEPATLSYREKTVYGRTPVTLSFPASALPCPGRYTVVVSGRQSAGDAPNPTSLNIDFEHSLD